MTQDLFDMKRYVKNSFEKIAPDWDRLREKPWNVLIEFFEQFGYLNLFCKEYLVDLGCGNGRHALWIADKVNHVIGVDFSFNLLKMANKKRAAEEITNVSYIMADITLLPFKEHSISDSFFLATLHHIPMRENRLKILEEVKYILKENGYCLLTVWRRWQKRFLGHFIKQFFQHLLKFPSIKEFGDIYIPWKKQNAEIIQRFYHLFSQRELRKLCHQTGFQVVLLKNFGGPTRKDNIFSILKKIN